MIKLSQGQLCSHCRKQVEEKEILLNRRFYKGIPHYYLFEWSEESHHFCKQVIYFLKNKKQSYFKEWVSYIGHEIENKEVLAILTPKSTSGEKVNHGHSLSLELLKLFPYSCVIETEAGKKGPQKRKTKKERLSVGESKGFNAYLLDSSWVFADDVFVTGGTYESVRKSVGSDPECIVTLFYRALWENEDDG